MYQINTIWKNKLAFESQVDKHTVRIDTNPPLGDDSGPSPKKLLLVSLAGCTGMDVASLLEKMRVPIKDLHIYSEADLTEEHPKVFSAIRLTYRIWGKDLDRSKVEKAITLSQDKYCGVSAMLKMVCPLTYEIEYMED